MPTNPPRNPPGAFFALLIGIVVGYQGLRPLWHLFYWLVIAGLIAAHFWRY